MAVKALKREFPRVTDGTNSYYGGDQAWSDKKYVRGYGCGVAACANVLLHTVERKGPETTKADYIRFARHLRHFYLPVIPKFGMNGLFMSLGLNLYFLCKRMPFYSLWGCRFKNIDKITGEMLEKDIPVVIAAGPNWPNLWGKHAVNLYTLTDGKYTVSTGTRAHYMTVTAMDDEYYTVSSWGRKYYINKNEFREYVKKHSNALFSSILVIRERHRNVHF